jgi:hypothetical protein
MSKKAIYQTLLWTLFALFALGSCATVRLNQFEKFAEVSDAYAEAVDQFLDEAGNAAVDTDSAMLERLRPDLTSERREETIIAHNELIRERFLLLSDLRRHANLLRAYFEALGILAKSDAPSGIGEASKDIVTSLGKLSERIKEAQIGEYAATDFVGDAVPILVAHFKSAVIEKELKARAPTIEREIELQQAALMAVAEQMRTDLQIQLNYQELEDIVSPYVEDSDLASDWSGRRKKILKIGVSIASAVEAADAAEKLRLSFVALIEGRLSVDDLPALFEDINEIITVLEKIKGTFENEE